jgi:hypothetical protein
MNATLRELAERYFASLDAFLVAQRSMAEIKSAVLRRMQESGLSSAEVQNATVTVEGSRFHTGYDRAVMDAIVFDMTPQHPELAQRLLAARYSTPVPATVSIKKKRAVSA